MSCSWCVFTIVKRKSFQKLTASINSSFTEVKKIHFRENNVLKKIVAYEEIRQQFDMHEL